VFVCEVLQALTKWLIGIREDEAKFCFMFVEPDWTQAVAGSVNRERPYNE
jgi:hypothetical protein